MSITSTKGRIYRERKRPAKLEALLAQRQNAGMALTAALKEAGFDAIAGTETDFWNFDTDAPGSRPKKGKVVVAAGRDGAAASPIDPGPSPLQSPDARRRHR